MEFGTVLLCLALLEQRHTAESEGRLDFSVVLEATKTEGGIGLTPKVHRGSPYSVGRISFTGHNRINDSTLRRAMTLQERDLFDVGKLRRSLDRLNETGLIEPLALADVVISKRADGATADVTIPLRERDRRWWQLSGPIVPGLGSFHAQISSRLPPWGRGVFDASTYYVTFNLLGLAKPLLGVLPLLSKAPPAAVALERPFLPGQGLLSGFALSPQLDARSTIAHYGRTHVSRLLHATLGETTTESLAVPITGESRLSGELLVCNPPKPKLRWLKRGVLQAADIALAVLLP
jgi:hypothetical protein